MSVANVASFDLEEHHRIEAAVGVTVSVERKAEYGVRMEVATHRLLDQLAAARVLGTFYVVGEIARSNPQLAQLGPPPSSPLLTRVVSTRSTDQQRCT